MRRSSSIILLIAIVIIGLLVITFLTGNPSFGDKSSDSQFSKNSDRGLQTLPDTPPPFLTTFEEAMNQLHQYLRETAGPSSNFTIHYIRGTDLDNEGRASKWLFGVRYDNQSVLMYFDSSGWRSVPWEGAAPEKEIIPGSFVPPKGIIKYTNGLLSGSDEAQKDLIQRLDLINGRYIVTIIRQEKQQIFVFDAGTGALIP
jgi:hypothetical protein